MKQAKTDAQELIDLYRAEKLKEFEKESESTGVNSFSVTNFVLKWLATCQAAIW